MPVRILTKLFGLSYPRIKKIREATHLDVDQLFAKYKPRGKFTKIHQRARSYLHDLFKNNREPLTAKQLCQMLKDDIQLRVSCPNLKRFLR